MRRSLIILLAISAVFLPTALFAQSGPDLPSFLAGPQAWMPQGSELGRNSFGVFTSPLDSAFNLFQVQAGSGFRSLTTPYAFGGVDNLFGAPAVGAVSPFYVGAFVPGQTPWSVYAYLNHTSVSDQAGGTVYTSTPSYTVGSATYNWVQQQTVTAYQPRPLAAVNNDFVQALVGFGDITAGLGVKLNIADNALGANNSTAVLTRNYNATPAAAPTTTLDYTRTTVSTDARDTGAGNAPSISDVAFGIPFALKSGSLTHYINVAFEMAGSDASNSTTVTYTSPKDPASALATYTNTNAATTAKSSVYFIPLEYALFLPPLVKGSPKNQFIVTTDGFVSIAGTEYSTLSTSALFNYPGGAAASTPSTATDTRDSRAFGLGTSLKVGAGAVHSLYFQPATGVEYGIVPAVYLDYAHFVNGASLTSDTQVVTTDVNNNGVLTDAGVDTITTTTNSYTNALSDTTGLTSTDQFEVFISIPMVLKINPAGWIFGFTIATTPQAWYQFQGVSVASRTKTQTVATGAVGAAPTTTTTDFASTAPTTTFNNTWTFQALHTLGLNFSFEKVTLDVNLNFITVGGGAVSSLFDFNNLTLQATVPLS